MFSLIRDKARNSTIMASVIGVLLVSSFGISNISSNNQAFATIENDKISDSIKKACPNYEDNGNIKGIVSDILKACLHDGNSSEPPTTPNPNPETTSFPQNYVDFEAEAQVLSEDQNIDATITVTDTTSNYLNTYRVFASGGEPSFPNTDKFVIPVGDQYSVNVTVKFSPPQPPTPPGEPTRLPYTITIGSQYCEKVSDTMCTGTMGRSGEDLFVSIRALTPE